MAKTPTARLEALFQSNPKLYYRARTFLAEAQADTIRSIDRDTLVLLLANGETSLNLDADEEEIAEAIVFELELALERGDDSRGPPPGKLNDPATLEPLLCWLFSGKGSGIL